jgi:transcription initiation factor TFIIB
VTWTIHDKGLSTTIGWQDRGASGRRLSPEEQAKFYRLRKASKEQVIVNTF